MPNISQANEPSDAITMSQREADMVPATPRQRISFNRTTPLTLTGTWQDFPFVQTSQFDVTTFPSTRYDFTNKKLIANPNANYDQIYRVSLDLAVKPNSTSDAVKIQIRFVVPRPAGEGGQITFPLPESLGYIELPDELSGTTVTGLHFDYDVPTNSIIRQYGAYVQINYRSYRMNANLLTGLLSTVSTILNGTQRPQLTDAVLNMYAL